MPIAIYILALAAFVVGTQSYVFSGLLADLGIDASDHRMLSKPFAPKELVARVRDILAPSRPEASA